MFKNKVYKAILVGILLVLILSFTGCSNGRAKVLIGIYNPIQGKIQTAKDDGELWEWNWYEGDVAEETSSRTNFFANGKDITSLVSHYVPGAYYAPNYLAYNTNLNDGFYPTKIGCYSLCFYIATDWTSKNDCYHNEKYQGSKLTVNLDIFGVLNFDGNNLVPIDDCEWVKDTTTVGHYKFDDTLRSGVKPFKAEVHESGQYRFQTLDNISHREKLMEILVFTEGKYIKYEGIDSCNNDGNLVSEICLSQGDVVTVYVGPAIENDIAYYLENTEYNFNVKKI